MEKNLKEQVEYLEEVIIKISNDLCKVFENENKILDILQQMNWKNSSRKYLSL